MDITIISNNYFPEDSGIGLYSTGMAEFLALQHEVKVISATPYYPQWKIYPEYKNNGTFSQEVINGVTIFRFMQYTPENPTFKKRILQMVHFFLGSVRNVFKVKKSNVTIVVMPFTISVILGCFIKLIRGGKLWIHVQDFEFDAAFETGLSANKKGLFPKIIFKIENFLLNSGDVVSTISQGMLHKLGSKTISKTAFFPNWVDHSKINPETSIETSILKNAKFNILYSGNIGAKQDWDFFVRFAEALTDYDAVHITVMGEGAKCKELISEIKTFKNVSYFPPVRYEELNNVLCNANLHILFQKSTVIDTVMPSKILGMMASGVPSLVTGHYDSEVRVNFEKAQCGYYFSEENIQSIKDCIIQLSHNESLAKTLGKNGRRFVIEHFSYNKVMETFQQQLEALAKR